MLQKHITTTVLFLFTFYILRVRTKICQDIFVINEVSSFENQLKDCTIIAGYLKIVLIENVKASDYEGISFPKLVEIEGYVLVYRVNYLVSLGRLFPNLRVIRGYNLFLDYSLVLYDLEHLEEIGLYNLKYIARGSIRIEKCRRLCYVDTLNWRNILNPAHNITFSNANTDFSCPECPKRCNGLCWNKDHCQVVGDSNGCHPECAAGCYGKDAEHCNACRSYKDGNKCVKRCPKNKFRHSLLPYCLTKQECPKLIPGTWWIFNNECRRDCPSGYRRVSEEEGWCKDCKGLCPKECPGIQVDSIASAEELKGCVYINGELTLRINSAAVADELEKNLGSIEVIDDFLRIHRSYALTTLDFFKNLTLIRGMSLYNNRYGLVIYENPNLHKLANWKNFTIEKGTILFHYNSQLCLSEIDVLAKQLNLNYSEFDVSPYSNGDKKACVYINLNITIVNVTSTTAEFTWDDFALSNETSQLLGYLLYYIEDPFQNATIDDERDECDENNWNSVFVSNTTHEIEKLNAYAQYAYYIKTYVTLPALGGQTKIHYFMTLSDDPINPKIVRAKSESSNSVTLQWNPPEFPNGVLTHYVVVIYFEKDDPKFIARRDYCEHPHHIHTEDTKMSTDVSSTSANNYTCTCKEKPKIQSETFNSLCEKFDDMIRDPKYSGCKRYTYTIESNANGNENENISIVFDTQSLHHLVKRNYIPANSPNILEMNITNPNLTSYVIEGLRHFSMYIILLKACNSPTQCSGPEMVFQRTLKSIKADDIPAGLSINIDNYDVVIRWPEPKDPNSVIVAYNIEYQKTDLENAKAITKCIAREEYAFFGFKYRLGKFLPGIYAIRVQAISLAGFGKFSVVTEFEISPHSHGILTATLAAFVTIAVLIPVFAYCYCSYKQKSNLDQLRLIANVRSNETGSDYIEDEWEMDRDNVDIFKELGQGTFGMVFNGLIKPENRPCAVKTINDQANVHERIAFLNEASVMKSFSDAHHVVKLLGVVSRGNPPLVVMELMERGDLKSYLRRSRSPSTNITCSEMYRMAAEIADGMMYLSAKKFVHRDLAARNCMVSADHTVKIGDFGMTRDIYETDYYRKETGGLMPIRWMSPESLADGVFTSDSDVWSYGVVLWEIVTLAEQPYQGLANEQVLQFVTAQGTLERPLECPDLLYDVMEASWKWRPTHRPTFKDIVEKLEQHIGQHFRLVSFYHSSAGEEYRMNPRDRVYNPPALSVSFNRNSTVYWDALQDDFSL